MGTLLTQLEALELAAGVASWTDAKLALLRLCPRVGGASARASVDASGDGEAANAGAATNAEADAGATVGDAAGAGAPNALHDAFSSVSESDARCRGLPPLFIARPTPRACVPSPVGGADERASVRCEFALWTADNCADALTAVVGPAPGPALLGPARAWGEKEARAPC